MLNFDKTRFVTIQSGAVSIAGEARSLMRSLLAGGVERLFFMGTGGVQLLTLPAIELAQRRSTFPVERANFRRRSCSLRPPASTRRPSSSFPRCPARRRKASSCSPS